MTDDEVWTDCPGFEGRYKVSDRGRVMNARTDRVLTNPPNAGGLSQVTLYRADGTSKDCSVARLVCAAFRGPPPSPKFVAYHHNKVKDDNRASNLCWQPRAEVHGRLTEADVLEMRRRSREGATYTRLAADFEVAVSTAFNAILGRTWKHLTDPPANLDQVDEQ